MMQPILYDAALSAMYLTLGYVLVALCFMSLLELFLSSLKDQPPLIKMC